jgi:hypothetical protein
MGETSKNRRMTCGSRYVPRIRRPALNHEHGLFLAHVSSTRPYLWVSESGAWLRECAVVSALSPRLTARRSAG